MYVDEIKQFVKNRKNLETLIRAVRIYVEDIRIDFGLEIMCHANNEKRDTTINGRNKNTKSRKNQKAWRKKAYKYLGILETDIIK